MLRCMRPASQCNACCMCAHRAAAAPGAAQQRLGCRPQAAPRCQLAVVEPARLHRAQHAQVLLDGGKRGMVHQHLPAVAKVRHDCRQGSRQQQSRQGCRQVAARGVQVEAAAQCCGAAMRKHRLCHAHTASCSRTLGELEQRTALDGRAAGHVARHDAHAHAQPGKQRRLRAAADRRGSRLAAEEREARGRGQQAAGHGAQVAGLALGQRGARCAIAVSHVHAQQGRA